jgi:hypothetical protein
MIAEALHVALPIAAFAAAIYLERHRARVMSVIAFWDRHSELQGTYVGTWSVDLPPGTPAQQPAQAPFEDYIKIQWAAGGYAMGTGTNSRYGTYAFSGAFTGEALTMTYRAKEKSLRSHIGVIYLQTIFSAPGLKVAPTSRPLRGAQPIGSAVPTMHPTLSMSRRPPNPSIERTATGGLRPPASAAHVKR